MTIDINLLRAERGYNPDVVRQSEERRQRKDEGIANVNDIIQIDKDWREAIYKNEQARKDLNAISKEIAQRKKKDVKDPCQDLVDQSTKLKTSVLPDTEKKAWILSKQRDTLLHRIGNIVHDSVPVSNDEANNRIERTWGTIKRNIKIDGSLGFMHHHQILLKLNGVDFKKGVEAAGHRGYYLKGPGVLLNMALIQYGLSFLMRKKYTPVQPPYLMRKECMSAAAELKDFNETLYKIPNEHTQVPFHHHKNTPTYPDDPDDPHDPDVPVDPSKKHDTPKNCLEDSYLIATSEQPLCCLHRNDTLQDKDLPIRYAGFSTCFRKEAGSHGKDCWGIFRVHQFEKIEQFCITTPDKSWEMHEEMISIAEEFYQSLELPYRVVSIVSGALNDAAAKKYDLEAWFPGYEDYRELVSCSNCTDYQARDLDIRLGYKKQNQSEVPYVHLLNATLVATQRCLCCILENYQTPEGVRVPTVLIPFMGGQEFLHYPEDRINEPTTDVNTNKRSD